MAVLTCLWGGAPALAAAPSHRVVSGAVGGQSNAQFLADLGSADKTHDYRPLLATCDKLVAAQSRNFEVYRRRALARWGARQYDGALDDFSHAAKLASGKASPRAVAVMYYGRALIRREQFDTAAEAAELEGAVAADHSFTDPLNDLAWIRATNPDAALRNGHQAVDLADRACKTVPGSVRYLDTLAAAYAEAGDGKRAVSAETEAVKAAHLTSAMQAEYKPFLADSKDRLELYGRGGQYREDPRHIAVQTGPVTMQ